MSYRRVVQSSQVYDAILDAHQRSHHAGHTKTFHQVQLRYYGISREEVVWLLKHCTVCLQSRPSNTRAPLEPIESSYTLHRVQIDLVDMRAVPHNGYHWILHIKDHFSKFSFLYPLHNKTAVGVAKCIAEWLGIVGIPKIIQCDNGKEFKGVLLILLQKYGIKVINGRPRHPQTQGLVEQANGVMKTKLQCWLEEHEGQGWTDALPDIVLAMNRQSHSALGGKMPYEVFFGRKPRWEDRIQPSSQLQLTHVDEEVLDAVDEIAIEVQEIVDQDGDDYFPDISMTDIFSDSRLDQVYVTNHIYYIMIF